MFPLVEVIDGRHWRVTVDPPRQPLEQYLEGQGRFRALAADANRIAEVTRSLDERWELSTSRACRPRILATEYTDYTDYSA